MDGELPGDEMPYFRCPHCAYVGPPEWWVREGEGAEPLRPPVATACGRCKREFMVTDWAGFLPRDTAVRCERCGSVVTCPASAEVVMCRAGRGALICGRVMRGPTATPSTVVEQLPRIDPDAPIPERPGDIVIHRRPDPGESGRP
jgi:DNA-directed RNA polymerase subunit RPC12/RpoP